MKHSRPHLEQILSVMNQALEHHASEQDDPPLLAPAGAARAVSGGRSASRAAKVPGNVALTPALQSWWLSAGESGGSGLKSEVLLVLKP